ncbi:MAG: glycoside hydrolase family 9 protein [Bacteroidetes bacterium]|nr:glycoside hydrolase family 9 protein [Bacteroidota bacterium]
MEMRRTFFKIVSLCTLLNIHFLKSQEFCITRSGYFSVPGWDVLVFSNWYDGMFSDAKISGIEFIHHDRRTVTNGDVRLQPTPEQWDETPQLISRRIDTTTRSIIVDLEYPQYNFQYSIRVQAHGKSIWLTVELSKPLPEKLHGKAGFNLEFLPSAYFERGFIMDSTVGVFPLHPVSCHRKQSDTFEVLPFAQGRIFIAAPEDPSCRIEVRSKRNNLLLYDGRVVAQNGWYVLRSLIPSNKVGIVIEWEIQANIITNWKRTPQVLYSQVGYHPTQAKKVFIEYDARDNLETDSLYLLRIGVSNITENRKSLLVKPWGLYLRYMYGYADFSEITQEGLYCFEFRGKRTPVFRISKDIYTDLWYPTMDVFFPVQMDHMYVREAYRVWHGVSHLDDALQAPPNHIHFDLYAQGPTLDSHYQPYEHIPGLNIGGWFDAGDFDIRTQSQYTVVHMFSLVWEDFKPLRDETTVIQQERYVELHKPDHKPDILQQIEHGVHALLAQYRAFGHAIPGIVDGSLRTYTHIGDAASQTDNKIYTPRLKPYEIVGDSSGTFDDRWAFTTHTTALNYGAIAALASASRALNGYNDSLANECLRQAQKVWDEEHSSSPHLFRYGNTTGGNVVVEELKAAVELFLCTKEHKYKQRIEQIIQKDDTLLAAMVPYVARVYSQLTLKTQHIVRDFAFNYASMMKSIENPFGVPITTGGWAGNYQIVTVTILNYHLHKLFPNVISKDDVFRGIHYLLGCHPSASISFVSSVGTVSKKSAYGNNRADFSFIAGGVVPGILIIKPDYPENKEDWPFFWGQNEYVINIASQFVYAACAVQALLQ